MQSRMDVTRRVLSVAVLLLASLDVYASDVAVQERLTVADMLRFAKLGDPGSLDWMEDQSRQVSTVSPDGGQAAVVVRRGMVERGAIEGELLLFRLSEVLREPEARTLVRFESTTNDQPIGMVRWLDNRTLLFGATDGNAPTQIFRADSTTGELTRLTDEPTSVLWYAFDPPTQRLTVFRRMPVERYQQPKADCLESGCRVLARTFWDAESRRRTWADYFGSDVVTYDLYSGKRQVIDGPFQVEPGVDRCWGDRFSSELSAGGRFGILMCDIIDPPDWWHEYRGDNPLSPRSSVDEPITYPFRQLFLYDLEAGSYRALTSAPYAGWGSPLWIENGRRVVLPDAWETLEEVTGEERERRTVSRSVLVIDPITGAIERVAQLPLEVKLVTQARWDELSRTLIVDANDWRGKKLVSLAWRRGRKGWIATSVPTVTKTQQSAPIELLVAESPNKRPLLVARDQKTGVSRTVLDPNPWMDGFNLGEVSAVSWTSSDGRVWKGMLYYPPDYVPGRRYGLVIQTHGILPDQFSLEGYARNFAAQPLAARDLMVLQVEETIQGVEVTPAEWPTVQAGYEAGIEYLAAKELIDKARVGIVGWSRTGNYVGYALVHSDFPFAAAMQIDVNDFGWWTYLNWGVHPEIEAGYGAAPFGTGLGAWLNNAPSFQLARVRTPLLIWQRRTVNGLWDWYTGLRRLGRPVEHWVMPDGEHDLVKINHRMRVNTHLVDWFDFWLNSHEDPNPTKQEQYTRWRQLRGQQEAVLEQPRSPRFEWTAEPREK